MPNAVRMRLDSAPATRTAASSSNQNNTNSGASRGSGRIAGVGHQRLNDNIALRNNNANTALIASRWRIASHGKRAEPDDDSSRIATEGVREFPALGNGRAAVSLWLRRPTGTLARMAAPHAHDLRPFAHSHSFGDAAAPRRERALWWVTAITLATMVLELTVGYWSGSLALVADGWHMGTHALALGGAALAAL